MAKPTQEAFHVAIAGAGVAGLALAMGLHRKGISFTLYEEAPEYSVVGAGIGFGPNGMQALDLIEPGFRPLYEKICVGNKYDHHVFFELLRLEQGVGLDQPFYGKSKWGHPDYLRKSAHRKELLDIMTSFIPIKSVRFSKRLASVEQGPDGVTLTFGDGTTAQATVLAGSDGIQSTVREHVLGERYPSQVAPVYAGAYCYRGVIPIEEAYEILGDLTDVAKTYYGKKRGAVTYRISEGREFNFLLCVADSDKGWKLKNAVIERITPEAMLADFDDPSIDDRFRRLLSKARPIKWGLFHHAQTATYFRDRAVLIGDSAHASMPFQAAGAAQGIEDALVLTEVLAEIASRPERGEAQLLAIRASLTGYDAVRRPRAQRQLDQAHDLGLMVMGRHPETGADMEKILLRILQGRVNWLWYHDLNEDLQEALKQARTLISAGTDAVSV